MEFQNKIKEIIKDLKKVSAINVIIPAEIFLGDSTRIENVIKNKRFDRIITSPPYPNRFSYIHTTRPQLFFYGVD